MILIAHAKNARLTGRLLDGGEPRRVLKKRQAFEKARLGMEKDYLTLKRAATSRPSGEWNDDDFDMLADSVVVGRIMKVHAAPVGTPWMWTLTFGHHEDRWPTHGYEPTREATMAAQVARRKSIVNRLVVDSRR